MSRRPARGAVVAVAAIAAAASLAWWWARTPPGPELRPSRGDGAAARHAIGGGREAGDHDLSGGIEAQRAAPPPAGAPSPPLSSGLVPDRTVLLVGEVRSSVDDAPIEAATIVAVAAADPERRPLAETESGPDGRFELPLRGGLPAIVELRAEADDHAPGVERVEIAPSTAPRWVAFSLPRGFTIEVRVSGSDGPLARAEVVLSSTVRGFATGLDQRTDGEGRATFADVVDFPRHGLSLRASCDGWHSAEIAPLAVEAADGRLEVSIELAREQPLRGRVVAAAGGAPIADAEVELFSTAEADGTAGDETTTDVEGAFDIGHDVVPPAIALLMVRAEGFQARRIARPARAAADGVLQVALAAGCSWRGVVVAAESGDPLPGAEVRALPADLPEGSADSLEVSATADGEGRFELALAELPAGGPVRIEVEAAGRAIVTREVEFIDGASPAAWPERFEVSASVRVSGRVVRGDDGAGVARARVRLVKDGVTLAPVTGSRTISGSDGGFELLVGAECFEAGGVSLVVESGRTRHPCGVLAAPPPEGAEPLLVVLPNAPSPLRR
jgi:hypothetical protein